MLAATALYLVTCLKWVHKHKHDCDKVCVPILCDIITDPLQIHSSSLDMSAYTSLALIIITITLQLLLPYDISHS